MKVECTLNSLICNNGWNCSITKVGIDYLWLLDKSVMEDETPYLIFDIPRCVNMDMGRNGTSSQCLKVVTGRWTSPKTISHRICDLCNLGIVQDTVDTALSLKRFQTGLKRREKKCMKKRSENLV